jgi:hypothetical protein
MLSNRLLDKSVQSFKATEGLGFTTSPMTSWKQQIDFQRSVRLAVRASDKFPEEYLLN